ncbi:MAG: tRNA (adenosine(37)-N6)-dimethylallyltransferase MiaA [Bacteroidota bacterium]
MPENKKTNLICILGHTAGGKTAFAAHLAHKLDGEIISADSRQVYRHMNIGTGKDLEDYIVAGRTIPCHLIDIADPGYEYNVFEYQKDFLQVFHAIRNRGKIPVLCGGTGLYIEAVLKAYKLINVPHDTELRERLKTKDHDELVERLKSFKTLHNVTDTENRKRLIRAIEIEEYYVKNPDLHTDYPEINSTILGIKFDRESRRKRITERLLKRLTEGMIEEVEGLLEKGLPEEKLLYYGLEYKFISLYIKGRLSYNEMVSKLNTAIHQFAKRQMTWFRGMERRGFNIHWIDGHLPLEEKIKRGLEVIESEG